MRRWEEELFGDDGVPVSGRLRDGRVVLSDRHRSLVLPRETERLFYWGDRVHKSELFEALLSGGEHLGRLDFARALIGPVEDYGGRCARLHGRLFLLWQIFELLDLAPGIDRVEGIYVGDAVLRVEGPGWIYLQTRMLTRDEVEDARAAVAQKGAQL